MAQPGASFSATQKTRFASSDYEVVSTLTYGHHRLRIDPRRGPSIVLDMKTGQMWIIERTKKRFATATLDQMAQMRKRLRASFAQQLKSAPPDVRRQLTQQMEQVQSFHQSKLTPLFQGEDKTGRLGCSALSWKQGRRRGRACVAASGLPFSVKDFRADCARVVALIRKSGAGTAATSLAFLQLGTYGLPVRFEQTMTMGSSQQNQVSVLEKVAPSRKPASFFAPSGMHTQVPFESLMGPPSSEF